MKKRTLAIVLVLCVLLVYLVACSKSKPKPRTVIHSFSPQNATANDPVRILGANFNEVASVSFGGRPAASFKIVSGTEILAYPGSGASGAITIKNNDSSTVNVSGFTYYVPRYFSLTGTAVVGAVPWPQMDSSQGRFINEQDSGSFTIRYINRNDTAALQTNIGTGTTSISKYADSANYVILNGTVIRSYLVFGVPTAVTTYQFSVMKERSSASVFARITDSVITIPLQHPYHELSISGTGIIRNDKIISLRYLVEKKGASKQGVLRSP